MKEIVLNNGELVAVDNEDFDYLNQFKWHVHEGRHTNYAVRTIYLGGGRKNRKMSAILMHREIMGLGKRNKTVIDHKDGNGLNNQRNNLRESTYSQNQMNKKAKGKSKYLGVSLHVSKYKDKRYVGWLAQIKIDSGKVLSLGKYKTEEEAAIAYNDAAKKYHKEYAKLNQI